MIYKQINNEILPLTAEEEAVFLAAQTALSAPVEPPPSPRESLRLAWIAQPVAIRAAFSSTYAATNLALDQGDFELAVYLVSSAHVPPELEAAKAQILQMVEAMTP